MSDDYTELKPLAAVIEHSIQETPIRLGTDDWGTILGARLLADVSVYMGRVLGPDASVLAAIANERARQDAKWGEQNHPNGTGLAGDDGRAELAREVCQAMARRGETTWRGVLAEEVAEAFAETDPALLRNELVQVAAVCAAWIAAIDRLDLEPVR
ncbi:NUDIX hydrolase [Streptomyces sp. NPDC053086]|uniref:NUDIX hydrolase n=1 Tax=unclassified Streptomyces TaxID=2593676 RepID=UPI0037CD407B